MQFGDEKIKSLTGTIEAQEALTESFLSLNKVHYNSQLSRQKHISTDLREMPAINQMIYERNNLLSSCYLVKWVR